MAITVQTLNEADLSRPQTSPIFEKGEGTLSKHHGILSWEVEETSPSPFQAELGFETKFPMCLALFMWQ